MIYVIGGLILLGLLILALSLVRIACRADYEREQAAQVEWGNCPRCDTVGPIDEPCPVCSGKGRE